MRVFSAVPALTLTTCRRAASTRSAAAAQLLLQRLYALILARSPFLPPFHLLTSALRVLAWRHVPRLRLNAALN